MTTTPLLPNFLAGRWQDGSGNGATLLDPVLGTPLVRVSSAGLDLAEGFAFAREQGGAALRAMSYGQRAAMLGAMQKAAPPEIFDAVLEFAVRPSLTPRAFGDLAGRQLQRQRLQPTQFHLGVLVHHLLQRHQPALAHGLAHRFLLAAAAVVHAHGLLRAQRQQHGKQQGSGHGHATRYTPPV